MTPRSRRILTAVAVPFALFAWAGVALMFKPITSPQVWLPAAAGCVVAFISAVFLSTDEWRG